MKPAVIKKSLLVLFPLILLFGLGIILMIPQHYEELRESSMAEDLPFGYLNFNYLGIKRQESEIERKTLAQDTIFNKGDYYILEDGAVDRKKLPIHVSIVRSGQDMNASIHRPEICLPAQGHFNLKDSSASISLDNGKNISLTRLDTDLNVSPDSKSSTIIHGIYYYIFVGDGQLAANHASRYVLDIKDRLLFGKAQRWAYIQVGTYYGDAVGEDRETAEKRLQEFIKFLLPQVIVWNQIN